MNAIDELKAAIEEYWPHDHAPYRLCDTYPAVRFDAVADRLEREYMEYPKDAYGVPCRMNEKLYAEDGGEIVVSHVGKKTVRNYEGVICSAKHLSHVPPDSWEQIEADLDKNSRAYWDCFGSSCSECPARINGKNPATRYGKANCCLARHAELVSRCKALAGVE